MPFRKSLRRRRTGWNTLVAAALLLGWGGACKKSEPRQCIPGATRDCRGTEDCAGVETCQAGGKGFGACVCGQPIAPVTSTVAPAGECAPGDSRACSGPGGCAGAQVCTTDGTAFGACVCPQPAPSPGPVRDDVVGAPCTADTDCGSNLFCWTESTLGLAGLPGGPTGGYCTARCQLDTTCLAIEPFAHCFTFATDTPGLCFAGCISEGPAVGEVKCLGRTNLACWSIPELFGQTKTPMLRDRGVCFPKCDSDEDCPGRRCNRSFRVAVCSDDPPRPESGAIGDACTGPDDCTFGLCRDLGGGASACSASCVVGSPSSCGYGASATQRDAECLLPFEWSGGSSFGVGDIGLCAESCTESSDCKQPGFVCEATFVGDDIRRYCTFHASAASDAGTADSGSP